MASAGRILIIPKGDWNAEIEYEMLDLVRNSGKVWISKKKSIGIEPSADSNEYWMELIDLNGYMPEATNIVGLKDYILQVIAEKEETT